MMMEHVICRMKNYRIIIGKIFQNSLKRYDIVSDIASGLANYRMMNHN
jgi:hypothetical protein